MIYALGMRTANCRPAMAAGAGARPCEEQDVGARCLLTKEREGPGQRMYRLRGRPTKCDRAHTMAMYNARQDLAN